MMSKGPQIYPGAKLDLFFGNGQYSGSDMEVNVALLHTTEGIGLVNYRSGAVAPTGTLVPDFANKKLVMHQHFNIDESARALVNLDGGVETNTNNICQWELVGTCDPHTKGVWEKAGHVAGKDFIYWAEAPTWALDEVAKLLAWLNSNHQVPLTSEVGWKAYPDSYGTNNGVRMSFSKWNAFKGVCGHQHVPENLHGDPGLINIKYLLDHAKAIVNGTDKPALPVVKPTVDVSNAIRAFEDFPHHSAIGSITHIQEALKKLGLYTWHLDGIAGPTTKAAYKSYQKHLGYSGADADGIPGETSLTKLSRTTGLFIVVK